MRVGVGLTLLSIENTQGLMAASPLVSCLPYPLNHSDPLCPGPILHFFRLALCPSLPQMLTKSLVPMAGVEYNWRGALLSNEWRYCGSVAVYVPIMAAATAALSSCMMAP